MTPKLTRVMRLDSLPLNQTFFTPEGYLRDKPILTSTGIFEYKNPDGSIRRELRLPEEVFAKESLESYKGKPIIITHDAGLIDKENVHEEQIGTILSEGYKDGNDVRAEIVIHDTDEMKDCGYKELSLGYNLDLDETEGMYNGQHYDAIQRNIRVNHLALVREARAGDQARLNIDSRDNLSILKGGKAKMSVFKKNAKKTRRADSVLSPEELEKAIANYQAKRKADCVKNDEEETKNPNAPAAVGGELSPEEKLANVKKNIAARDEQEEPKDKEEALDLVTDQDDDINELINIIDSLLAERDFGKKTDSDDEEEEPDEVATDDDEDEIPNKEDTEITEEDGDEEEIPEDEEEDGDDEEEEDEPKLNADSLDYIVKQRVKLDKAGEILNLDGLENMSPKNAKKAVVNAVRPTMRLDGKTNAYVDAAFDMAYAEIIKSSKKDISYQYKQMFNKDSKSARTAKKSGANAARESMMKRMFEKGDK